MHSESTFFVSIKIDHKKFTVFNAKKIPLNLFPTDLRTGEEKLLEYKQHFDNYPID